MRYSLEQLETFAAVAQAGSFSAAARQLGKTQSTVSAAIGNLEVDLGVALFDRATKIPTLTEAGHRMLREANGVLDRCLALEGHAQSLAESVESGLTLAIEIPYNVLMPAFAAFAAQFPYVDLEVRHPLHGDVSALVQQGEAQLGIGFAQPGYARELDFVQMGKLVMAHVAARGHPLAAMAAVNFTDLHRHRRLAFSAHSERLPTTEYLGATRCWRAESYLALLEMTRAGLGWATLPRRLVQRELADGELVELQLGAYPHTDWLLGVDLLWNKARPLGKAGTWLRTELARFKVSETDSAGHPTTF
ncbi:LysR family transcriptional regulator [Variovorax sp. PAMC26660]|uniref:LysR family transcriptional regulator n=1 Tax=Variovorax sp. PAMC26660 TaxID=2762322 RepID=UPI00164E8227|nr:LysR family transcriptional regulator [Variovorax sp. PAMC26660]QNK70694.1 LysR family transcriptional regulator [Variovorax sp. PAMC26660]